VQIVLYEPFAVDSGSDIAELEVFRDKFPGDHGGDRSCLFMTLGIVGRFCRDAKRILYGDVPSAPCEQDDGSMIL
jgi:hypothetical protein